MTLTIDNEYEGIIYEQKQILCTGLSLALLLSSVITTPASIAAGKYFKIQYIHSKKKSKESHQCQI